MYGESSYTILETLIFNAFGDGLQLAVPGNGILNLARSTVMCARGYGMRFFDKNAWNVEVFSSLFANNEDAAFALASDGDNNLLTLIDTCYEGIDRFGDNALKSSGSVNTDDDGDSELCSKVGITRPDLLKKLSDLLNGGDGESDKNDKGDENDGDIDKQPPAAAFSG